MSDTTYNEDKRYILETLKHTSEYVGKLGEKLEDLKLETATSIVAIQTKLAIYVAGGSVITGIAVNLIMHSIKGH